MTIRQCECIMASVSGFVIASVWIFRIMLCCLTSHITSINCHL